MVKDVFEFVARAREAGKTALGRLRSEIASTRTQLEKLLAEERSFRVDLFGTGAPGRPQTTGRAKAGRPATARPVKPLHKGPPKADRYFNRLPAKFTLDDVRKLAGRASGVSIAQWVRARKVKKKTAGGYEKTA